MRIFFRFLTRRRCQGRLKRNMQLQAVQTTRTHLYMHRPKRKRDPKRCTSIIQGKSVRQADLRWKEMGFELALESADTSTRSKIWWQRIPNFWSSIAERAPAYFRSNVWDRK